MEFKNKKTGALRKNLMKCYNFTTLKAGLEYAFDFINVIYKWWFRVSVPGPGESTRKPCGCWCTPNQGNTLPLKFE